MQKILVVEDDKFLRSLIVRQLKEEGFQVNEAIDGEDAIQKIIHDRPDLILLDIILPKKSGFSVLSDIKQDPNLSLIPVIIISQLGQPEDIEKGKTMGVQEYIIKANTSLKDIINLVKKFFGKD